jgi:ribosome-associated protein
MDKIVDVVVSALQDLKAKEIKVLDLRKLENAVCEYFVVCHGTSTTHTSSLANSVSKEVKTVFGMKPWRKEGFGNNSWVILDYSSVVVHVFLEEARHFYNIEDLWADAEITEFEQEI